MVEVKLKGNLSAALDNFEREISQQVLMSGVAAMAKVIYDEVKLNTTGVKANTPGIVTGNLHESIYRVFSKERSGDKTKTYQISWNKTKAPHGHLLEFGTSRAPAYPFVRPAFSRVQDAIKAGQARMAEKIKEL